MSKGRNRETKIGIAMYRPEDWTRLREIAADRDDIETTWTEWSRGIAELERQLRSAGRPHETVLVHLGELVRYCQEHGLPNDARARASVVSDVLRHEHQRKESDGLDG